MLSPHGEIQVSLKRRKVYLFLDAVHVTAARPAALGRLGRTPIVELAVRVAAVVAAHVVVERVVAAVRAVH